MCLILALVFSFGGLVACGNKDDDSDEAATVIITFDYSAYEGVVWDEDFDEEMEIEANQKIGDLPKPTLAGYTFKGWYEDVEDTTTKLKKTSKFTEDATYYALFAVASTGGETGGETTYNCAAGAHKYEYTYTPATCTADGTQTSKCSLCGYQEIDPLYSTLPANKKLGHQWVEEGTTGDGWTVIALARKRTCLREGCDYAEEEKFENLTSNTTLSVTAIQGGYPATSEWPGTLTDGKWGTGTGGAGSVAPKGGEVVFTFIFTTPSEIDQIVMDVKGLGEDGYCSKFKIFFWYVGEETFREEASYSDAWLSTHWGRDNALCVDRSQDDNPLMGIKIVMENARNGEELFYEMAIGRIPDEG